MNMKYLIEKINHDANIIMTDVLADLITDHEQKHDRMISNYKRYKASADPDGVPVFSRKFEDTSKINHKINDAFDADIVDVKTGYMLGNPVIYALDKEKYTTGETLNEQRYDSDSLVINDFNTRNNIEDIDGETLKAATICGYGARLLYINKDGIESVMNVEPWECIFIKDGSLDEPQYAMRYYQINDAGKIRTYVEWYDENNISFYVSEEVPEKRLRDDKLKFTPYAKNGAAVIPHMFDGIPLIQFLNNKEAQGDCDKVYSSIDAYDSTISDVNSELEQFRLAYMAFYGMTPDEETIRNAKRTGAFGMPDPDSRIEFITKELDDVIITNQLKRLEQNIYRFAKSVNFSDEAFAGTVTGIAMKFKMFGLESKCIVSERKFTSALRIQYRLLTSIWKAKSTTIDYMSIQYVWTRNFPLNLVDESISSMNFKGLISDKTRLGLLSFIDNPENELKQMELENANNIDLNEPQLDENGNPIEQAGNKTKIVNAAENITGKTLNGAQTQSLLSVISQYTAKTLSLGQAINIIAISVGVTKEEAQALLEGAV